MNIKRFIYRQRHLAAAFFLPVLAMILAFALTGIYPFGENQITVIDMYHQYVPFLSELQYKLHHGGSLFYSWDGAGGFNFWNLLSYYGASPLNLLLFLFPEGLIVEGVTVILLIKVGLAGSFMYLFLTHRFSREALIWMHSESAGAWCRVIFSALYALCAYVCGYFWCIMWLDVVALLPLIILGLTRLVEEGRGLMYAVTLGLACFCNYYISMMMCIFIVLYYLMLYFSRPREGGWKGFLAATGRTALYSVLGAALSAPMLIPTYISMKNTYYTPSALPETWEFYSQPLEVVNQLLPLSHVSYRSGLPNLWCGLLVCMMLVCFFAGRSIPLREKVAHGLLLAVLFFSLNVNKLDFLWHGCHFPNELPFRWSFAVSFLLVTMGCRAMMRLPQLRFQMIWTILAGGLAWYLIMAKLLEDALDDSDEFFYIGVTLLGLYTALMVIFRKGWLGPRGTMLLVMLVVAAELVCTVTMSFDKVGNVERAPYLENRKEIAQLTEKHADEFARTELFEWGIMNTPALYHYRGLSQFSSSINARATTLMEKIGLEGEPGKNRYNYVISDPVTNAILNLKYIIVTDAPMEDDNFTWLDSVENCELFESRYPLAVGYMLPFSIRTWDMISTNPFKVLDDYVRAATDNQISRVFRELEEAEIETSDVSYTDEGDGLMSAYAEDSEDAGLRMVYSARETGNHYVYVEAEQAESIDVIYKDGDTRSLREDCGAVVNIGKIKKGEDFTLEIRYEADAGGSVRAHVCTLDQAAWDEAYGMISRDQLELTGFGDRFLEGKIHASSEGMFTTSVLFEQGWSLRVDGIKREISETVGGDFIAIPLSAGDHTIRLSFLPPGLGNGSLCMAISILLLIALSFMERPRPRRRKAEKVGEIPEEIPLEDNDAITADL